jgi:hypothetical protein
VVLDALVHSRLATTSVGLLKPLSDFGLLASFFSAFRDARSSAVAAPSATASCHTPRIIPGKRAPESPTQEVPGIGLRHHAATLRPAGEEARSGVDAETPREATGAEVRHWRQPHPRSVHGPSRIEPDEAAGRGYPERFVDDDRQDVIYLWRVRPTR